MFYAICEGQRRLSDNCKRRKSENASRMSRDKPRVLKQKRLGPQACSALSQVLCCHLGLQVDRSHHRHHPPFLPPHVFLFFLIFTAPPPSLSLCFHALCQSCGARLKSGKVISLSQISPVTVVRHACLKVFAVEARRGCGISHLSTF